MSAYGALKLRHRRFLDEYLLGRTGADAIRAIGYTGKCADVQAYKILHREDVRAALAERRAQLLDAVGLRQEQIVRELMHIGFARQPRLYREDGSLKSLAELDESTAAAVASVESEELFDWMVDGEGHKRRAHVGTVRKVKLWDKVKALAELAEIAGLKKVEGPPPNVGPGMTIIVQQGMPAAAGPAPLQHVVVNLPGPPK